uniref:Phagocyte signaling-impaired protein n=1 Tax=Schistocephalus solidus TaxID=70667 RepID=A0A0X3P836_SCHSO
MQTLRLRTLRVIVQESINAKDYNHDYSRELLELNAHLQRWDDVIRISSDLLQSDADEWVAWSLLMRCTFDGDMTTEPSRNRMKQTEVLVKKYRKQNPKCRGPLLAHIDFVGNIVQRNLEYPNIDEAFCKDLIKTFFDKFSSRLICAMDIAYVIPVLLPDEKRRKAFVASILKQATVKSPNAADADYQDAIYRHVCAYRIARTNGVKVEIRHLLETYGRIAQSNVDTLAEATGKINLTDATKKTQNGGGTDNASITDMLPQDGLLLLAVSELLDPLKLDSVKDSSAPVTAKSDEHQLGLLLLATYWLHSIGLRESPANHFMRLRLTALLSSAAGLCCSTIQLKVMEPLDLKQLLLTSLGHMVITPGPHLTIWSHTRPVTAKKLESNKSTPSSDSPDSQSGMENADLADFYHMLTERTRLMISESEEWLVGAYKQRTYTQIRDFCQFLHKLRHADSGLLAKTETIYRKVLVLPNSFDEALETLGDASLQVTSIKELLGEIVDCRDFTVVPEFTWREQNPVNQLDTFNHEKNWLRFRLDMVDLFGACAKLVMRSVVKIELLASFSPNSAATAPQPEAEGVDNAAPKNAQELTAAITSLGYNLPSVNSLHFKYNDLLLTPDTIFATPPPLPKTSILAFYHYGPFGETLRACLKLLSSLVLQVDGNPGKAPEADNEKLMQDISSPLESMLGDEKMASKFSLPAAPLTTTGDSSSLEHHPGAILVGLGVAVETLSMAILFLSALVSMLRPRRYAHPPTVKQGKKKSAKGQASQSSTVPREHCALAAHLDSFAVNLHCQTAKKTGVSRTAIASPGRRLVRMVCCRGYTYYPGRLCR